VFAPMIAIQIADFFILKRDVSEMSLCLPNMLVWAAGFIAYRLLMNVDTPVGYTLVDMAITIALCVAAAKLIKEKGNKPSTN
ncbi:MAG: putative hydroxymethylpyrimidine transporter CytX, partial [Eubacteriales bacterium]|nr:putative hydroxymethylpyrimidine transporter CytX [Eubacteriales bacterium]